MRTTDHPLYMETWEFLGMSSSRLNADILSDKIEGDTDLFPVFRTRCSDPCNYLKFKCSFTKLGVVNLKIGKMKVSSNSLKALISKSKHT